MFTVMEGLIIIAKYCNDIESEMSAAHDQIWAGCPKSVVDMSEQDKRKMEDLGWFPSESGWSTFV